MDLISENIARHHHGAKPTAEKQEMTEVNEGPGPARDKMGFIAGNFAGRGLWFDRSRAVTRLERK
jgi:hypothetical protein